MPDKRCPNCGLWNVQQAILCDCGYDFDACVLRGANSSPQPAVKSSLLKAALGGALGAFLAIFPVSFLKTLYLWYSTELCRRLLLHNPQLPVALTPCGITLFSLSAIPFWTYFLSTLIGAALLSMLMVFVFLRVTAVKFPNLLRRGTIPIFWPSFLIGILSVVLFGFILLYPGQ